jgi:thiol-disulfide isomerase/thioredoxin
VSSEKVNAPDFDGAQGWLNTDKPLSMKQLRGKIVLLDFWTFCCINCMHVIPDLHKLEFQYPNELVVIGVHSAKFDNERDSNNIREAILRYGIEHPVVNDAKFAIWNAYTVHAWPTFVLIDPDGRIAATFSGEGHYEEVSAAIASLVKEFSANGRLDRKQPHFVLERQKQGARTPLAFPGKICADEVGQRLFISDTGHNRIVVVNTAGRVLDMIGNGQSGATDGAYDKATFHHPQGLAYDGLRRLFVADTENHLIRLVDLKKKSVSTIAGTGKQAGPHASGGSAESTALNSPWDLTLVGDALYIAMAGAHQIWRLDLIDQSVHPFAGNGAENIVDGLLETSSLAQPSGLTTDGKKLYFADSEVSAVRSADLTKDGKVKTIVGEGLFAFGDRDGIGEQVRLQHPLGVVWHKDLLYVADSYNHKIKAIDPNTLTSTTFAGTGKPGQMDGKPAQFSEPGGLCILGDHIYVADTNNNEIRVVNLNNGDTQLFGIDDLKPPPLTIAHVEVAADSKPIKNVVPGVEDVPVSPLQLRANSSGKVDINLRLPEGFHLNPEAPASYNLDQQGGALDFGSNPLQKSVSPPSLHIEIPFKSSHAGVASMLRITIPIYYCTEDRNSVCLTKTVRINVPVSVKDDASSTDIKVEHEIAGQ